MDRQARQAGNPLRTALVGIQRIAGAADKALDKVGRWQYFAPFFPEFAGNNNPSSLVTNPYANLSRAGLAARGLRLTSDDPQPLEILERVRAGMDDPVYQAVARDLAGRADDAPYRALSHDLAEAFEREGCAPEKVEDFLETSLALLTGRRAEGFAAAFLTHLVGCCIAEPDSYVLELDSLCALDPAAYQQVFGTRAPAEEPAGPNGPDDMASGARETPSFALEVGSFAEVGAGLGAGPGTWEPAGAGPVAQGTGAVYYLPGAAGLRRSYPLPPAGTAGLSVAVGRHPEQDGTSLALGNIDRSVSMEHFILHARDGAVRIEDWSTCGTAVLRQKESGDFEEVRLGELVDEADGAPTGSMGRFAGHKALGRRMRDGEMPELRDGDIVIPAPRYRRTADGRVALDLVACPVVVRFSRSAAHA